MDTDTAALKAMANNAKKAKEALIAAQKFDEAREEQKKEQALMARIKELEVTR